VLVATSGMSGSSRKIADGASELLQTFSEKTKTLADWYGVASLPLGVPVELG